jgi:lysyl-tRNA synthetase class 1
VLLIYNRVEQKGKKIMSLQKTWPLIEARKILERFKEGDVVIQAGFGASGVPHIGTIQEVIRSIWIADSVKRLAPTRKVSVLVVVDDLDGLRKVPTGFPQSLKRYLGYPVCDIPYDGGLFSDKMVEVLIETLNNLDLLTEVEIVKSSERYRRGDFDHLLRGIFRRYSEVESAGLTGVQRDTWSPFMPLCRTCGRVNTTLVIETHIAEQSISYYCEGCGSTHNRVPVNGREVKLTWKADWAMRWQENRVSYEIYGKDVLDSHRTAMKIASAMGWSRPQGMSYQLFVDAEGRKISKSKGNGITLDQLLRWGTKESLYSMVYRNPNKGIELSQRSLSASLDKLILDLERTTPTDRFGTYLEYVMREDIKAQAPRITFSTLRNITDILSVSTTEPVTRYLEERMGLISLTEMELRMVEASVATFKEVIEPNRRFTLDTSFLTEINSLLRYIKQGHTTEEVVSEAFRIARDSNDVKGFFSSFYQVLLGQPQGPRLPLLIEVFGRDNMVRRTESNIARALQPPYREVVKGLPLVNENLELRLRRLYHSNISVSPYFKMLSGLLPSNKRRGGLYRYLPSGHEARIVKVQSKKGLHYAVVVLKVSYKSGRLQLINIKLFRSCRTALGFFKELSE